MSSSRAIGTFLCIMMFLATLAPVSALSIEAMSTSSRGIPYYWNNSVQPTDDAFHYEMPRMAIDSKDDVHLVFLNDTVNVTYMKMDPDHLVVSGPSNIATLNLTWKIPPAIVVDGNDDIHISVVDIRPGMMGSTVYYHRYFMIDGSSGVVTEFNDTGGEVLVVDDNDDVYGLRYYRYGGTNPPPNGPIALKKFDGGGGEDWSKDLGTISTGGSIAAMAVTGTGDIIVVWSYGDNTLSFSRVSAAGVIEVNGVTLDTNLSSGTDRVMDVAITVDSKDRVHIFYNYNVPFMSDYYIYHKITDVDGDGSYNKRVADKTETRRPDIDVAGPDHAGVMGILYGFGADGSPWELSKTYRTKFIRTDGQLMKPQQDIISACPSYEGDLAINSSNFFHMVTDNRTCNQGQPNNDRSDPIVFYAESVPPLMFDLSVVEGDVAIPSGILQMDPFTLNTTVSNLEANWSSDFDVILSYTDNSTTIDTITSGGVGPVSSISLEFNVTLNTTTDLTFEIVPAIDMDIDLSNNILDITVPIIERPNVRIVEAEVLVDPSSLRIGEDTTISVPVENTGGTDASLVMRLGPIILVDIPIDVASGSKVWVNQTWSTMTPGIHPFTASLHNITPAELPGQEGDNHIDLSITYIDKTPPVLTIDEPINGSVVPDNFLVNGTVTDAEGDPIDLRIFLDGKLLSVAPVLDGTNYSYELDLKDKKYGSHNITIIACDQFNCTDGSVIVILRYSEILAKITDWTPRDHNVTILENGSIDFGITTWTNSELPFKYIWYLNTKMVVEDVTNWTYNDTTVEIGNHSVRVTAQIDDIVLEMTWNVTVEEIVIPNTPPVITSRTPNDLYIPIGCEDSRMYVNLSVDDVDGDVLTVSMFIEGKFVSETSDVGPGSNVSFKVQVDDMHRDRRVIFHVYDGEDNISLEYRFIPPPADGCGGGLPPPRPKDNSSFLDSAMWLAIIIVIIIAVMVMILWFNKRQKGATTETPPQETQGPAHEEHPRPHEGPQENDLNSPNEPHGGSSNNGTTSIYDEP